MKTIKVIKTGIKTDGEDWGLSDEYYQWNDIVMKILGKEAGGIWSATTLIDLLNKKYGFDIEYKDNGVHITEIIFPDEKKYLLFLLKAT